MAMQRDGESRLTTAALLAVLLIVVGAAASFAAPALQRTVTEALIKLVVVVGMYIFVGNSGVLSFGHVSFMALGGYMSAILTIPPDKKQVLLDLPAFLAGLQLPGIASALVAAGFAGVVALAVGVPLMRLRGIALPMATFALLAITHVVALNWKEVTGGRQALVGLPRFTTLWVALVAAIITLFAAAAYQQTRRGLLLRCSRENEVAAAATGIHVQRERLIAFALSAVFVGLGGVLFAHFLGTMTANTLYLDVTFITLTMLVVGGMRSLTGACVGTALVSIIAEVFRTIEKGFDVGGLQIGAPPGLQEIALSLILLAILIFRPNGLVGDWEMNWPSRLHSVVRAAAAPSKSEED
jgi:branched-chain amino acid transport system permease protein